VGGSAPARGGPLSNGDSTIAQPDADRPPETVIEIDHVTKRYGRFPAVIDADFDIARGEFFSLLGPSGCGKTTTLRLIAGFEQPSEGAIRLEGRDVSKVPPYRRNVNTVFQQYALFPHMSVWDNVAFGPRTAKVAKFETKQRVTDMLEIVRLGDFANRKPGQLSGGQQQRVALARALVNYPSALLLDEPLGALDLKLRQAMQLELKRIQREVGITFIYVTHDQEEALTMSDRIAVINEGHVEQIDSPEAIYHAPASVFVAGFIGQANLMPGAVTRDDGTNAAVSLAGGRTATVPSGASAFAANAPVTLMVRPERMQVKMDEPSSGEIAVPAAVTDLVFQGPVVRCALALDDGTEIVAHVGPDDALPMLRPGDRVWAAWEPPAGCLLAGHTQIKTLEEELAITGSKS